jgi:cation diffusion facilitator family transporter
MHSTSIETIRCRGRRAPLLVANERGTRIVLALTLVTMAAELAFGHLSGSLALTADGWHMATHAGAMGIASVAYWYARSRASDPRFPFGTGKVYALAGYTSAVLLLVAAASMILEAAERLLHPVKVDYREALPVAIIGLFVNLLSLKLLHQGEQAEDLLRGERHDDHDHDHDHAHDHNHRAAYTHLLADAVTSVLAIAALLAGSRLGWTILDPLMGALGGVVVLRWGVGLCRGAGRVLVDATASPALEAEIREALQASGDVRVADVHSWVTGPGQRSAVVSLVTSAPRPPSEYQRIVQSQLGIDHLHVEVHPCADGHPARAAG